MNLFAQKLIHWYHNNSRNLPWRNTTDPYLIWISEIILQQTKVNQGYNYYLRFIERFPDLKSLAAASEDEVLKYWQGLGYYSRARNLHQAAINTKGIFPTTYQDILAMKGVGPYTAAAISSIAYNQAIAVVDGNVFRVLSRYLNIDTPIDTTEGKKLFTDMAQEMLDKANPAIYNQAIMDFGALQCTPTNPACITCPIANSCIAYNTNKVKLLPIKKNHISTQNRYFNYFYIKHKEKILIYKRVGNDIWKNLYELPLVETTGNNNLDSIIASKDFQKLFSNINSPTIRIISKVKHVLTHRIIYATFYEMNIQGTLSFPDNYNFISIKQWKDYAMPQLIYRFLTENL